MNFFDIRNNINNIDLLKKYLDKNIAIQDDIENLIGEAIVKKNSIAISLINLYILENNIKITKNGVFMGIYYAKFREEYTRATEGIIFSRISCADWGETPSHFGEYYEKYNHIFKIHDEKDKKHVDLESAKIFLHNYSANNINDINDIDVFGIIGYNNNEKQQSKNCFISCLIS
jgi:hypothetical protein